MKYAMLILSPNETAQINTQNNDVIVIHASYENVTIADSNNQTIVTLSKPGETYVLQKGSGIYTIKNNSATNETYETVIYY